MAINKNTAARARRILEIAASMAEKHGWTVTGQIEDMQIHYDGYAEPGYSTGECGLVATGNWNCVTRWNNSTKQNETISDLPARIGNLFEKMGIEIEWSDEWSTCSHCYKLVRTSPDSYSWKRSFYMAPDSCEIDCVDCIEEDPTSYLESLEGNADACVTIDGIDPADHGYVLVNEESYATGWHPGQNDDPTKVASDLEDRGITRYVFMLDSVGQFDSHWSVYVHEDEQDLLHDKAV